MSDVSRILEQAAAGDPAAASQLLPLVYDELRKLATVRLMQERPGQTLQATALVHEAYLKLVGSDGDRSFANRRHFFACAAEAMRQILIDQARRKMAVRHGGDRQRLPNPPELGATDSDPEQLVALHELIDQLAQSHPRPGEVAKMRLFLQMTFVEIGSVLGVSPDTAEADWAYARAWLKRAWQTN